MELPSSSGELLVICRDVSLPVERLSNHIVQQALIRQPWPPGVLISIARGRCNPRQSPAGHLITVVAPSSLNPYYCLPSYVLTPCSTSLTHPQRHTCAQGTTIPPSFHSREDVRLIILEMYMSWYVVAAFHVVSFFMAVRSAAVFEILAISPINLTSL